MTAEAPASASISAEISPVKAPSGSGWQSCPPMATGEPRVSSANAAISVAGGQISRSAAGVMPPAPAMIARSSDADVFNPFIFQLPATSGRRLSALLYSPQLNSSAVSRARQWRKVFATSHAVRASVAMYAARPYKGFWPRASGRRCSPQPTLTHAARSQKSFQQLAGQGGDGSGGRLPGHQLCDLGRGRHFPWVWSLHGRHGRLDRDYGGAVPADL